MATTGDRLVVIGEDGLQGSIEAASRPQAGQKEPVPVLLENGRRVLVPADVLQRRSDATYYVPLRLADLPQNDEQVVVPIVEERLEVRKRPIEKGRVRVRTTVHEREEEINELLNREDVEIKRVPINRQVDVPASARQEGDTLVVPLYEEVLVVEKRLVLREEIRITRRRTETRESKTVTLRRQDASVERVPVAKTEEGGVS